MPRDFLIHHPLLETGKVLIEPTVWKKVISFQQKESAAPEAGGILLGHRRGKHLHVVDATVPQPEDSRSRFRFSRQKESHQRIAHARWKEASGTIDYLGEWHTHPEGSPTPSGLDSAEWRKIYEFRKVPMIFMIIGWSSEIWVGVGAGAQLLGACYETPAIRVE
ncbi:Mov34/MPN/PAD-1 family protein [Paraburkholderia youngii]|uniref:Mov34/MPN/PAD-1 family protein n=1 Tax=Paraburkholderia youngii TaxID=2782701 RepID=UPI003D1A1D41